MEEYNSKYFETPFRMKENYYENICTTNDRSYINLSYEEKRNFNTPKKYQSERNVVILNEAPKKNWSSMMLFNCEHPKTRALTPEVVSEAPASYLHGLEWTWDASVGEVDKTYNYLVGYYNDRIDPKVLHYTDGTPLHAGYENCEFAEEFMKYVQPRTE